VNADGDNLICIGPEEDPIIYYMKWTDFKWQGRWGLYLWLGVALGPPSWVRPHKIRSAAHPFFRFDFRHTTSAIQSRIEAIIVRKRKLSVD